MRVLSFIILMFVFGLNSQAQIYIGPNLGPVLGKTGDLQAYFYPKNEDWIAVSLSGGYTLGGQTFFSREKKECYQNLRNGGWHLRLGARNDLTTQNHSSHLYWELLGIYTRHQESAVINTCDTSSAAQTVVNQKLNMISGAVRIGYSWNPLHGKSIYQNFLIDFGLQIATPIWSSEPLLSERNHYSGLGFTWMPIRRVALEPVVTLRWRLHKRRYGFWKRKEKKRFED